VVDGKSALEMRDASVAVLGRFLAHKVRFLASCDISLLFTIFCHLFLLY
jgi:hypothetical protein